MRPHMRCVAVQVFDLLHNSMGASAREHSTLSGDATLPAETPDPWLRTGEMLTAMAAVLALLLAVARADMDPQVQAWLTASDVAVPDNNPPASGVNVPGDGCLSPKEIAYSTLVLPAGQTTPGVVETCVTALIFKEYQKNYNTFGTWPGPRLCHANLDGVAWSFFTDAPATFLPQCQESSAQNVYAFT